MIQTESQVFGLWICIMIVQGYVLGLLLGRGGRRQYPAFTSFIAFCVVRSLVLFYIATYAPELFPVVRSGAYLLQLPLLVMLLVEVFQCLFSPRSTLPKGTLAHFVEASLTCVALIVILTLRYPGQRYTRWVTCMWALDQAASWVMFTSFGLIALLATYFGIPWRHRLYGIALGFFLYLSADCVVATVAAQSSIEAWPIGMVAFLLACLTWAYYFRKAEVPRTPLDLEQLLRLTAVLKSFEASLSKVPCMAKHLRTAPGQVSERWAMSRSERTDA